MLCKAKRLGRDREKITFAFPQIASPPKHSTALCSQFYE